MCVNTATGPSEQLMVLRVHLTYSKKNCLRDFVQQYNNEKPLPQKLRSAHIKLMEYLINLYWVRLKSAHGAGRRAFVPGETLPSLRTSNGALAKEMSVSKRTIMNLRKRLEASNMITYKQWHGTNSSYEIEINPQILYLQAEGRNGNQNHHFFSPTVKSFHHIEEGTFLKDTNKEVNRSGEELSTGSDNQSVVGSGAVESCAKGGENDQKPVENSSSGRAKGTVGEGYNPCGTHPSGAEEGTEKETAPPSCAHPPKSLEPPQTPAQTVDEALAHLEHTQQVQVARIVRTVFAKAARKLYLNRGKWLSKSQIRQGQAALAEYIVWCTNLKMMGKVQQMLLDRIEIVHDWLNNVNEAALGDIHRDQRWIPLPNRYFDMRNHKSGFINTDRWWAKDRRKKARTKAEQAIDRAIIQYQKSWQPGQPYGPDEAYHTLSQTIRKKYGSEAVQTFLSRIVDLNLKFAA